MEAFVKIWVMTMGENVEQTAFAETLDAATTCPDPESALASLIIATPAVIRCASERHRDAGAVVGAGRKAEPLTAAAFDTAMMRMTMMMDDFFKPTLAEYHFDGPGSRALSDAAVTQTREHWWSLAQFLPAYPEASGSAGAHASCLRDEAAAKMVQNYEAVLRDVTNPSKTHSIKGNPLTQVKGARATPNDPRRRALATAIAPTAAAAAATLSTAG